MDSRTLAIIMMVFIGALLFPIFIGIVGGILGLVGSVIGGVFGFLGWLIGAIMGVIGAIVGGVFSIFDWWPHDHHWHFFHPNLLTAVVVVLIVIAIMRSRSHRKTG